MMINKAFTLIELIITIVLISMVVIPSSIFIVETIRGAFKSEDIIVAVNLARMEIERTNNLPFTHEDLDPGTTPFNFDGYNYDLYRVVTFIDGDPDIKEIKIEVKPADKEDLLTTVITHRTSYAE